MKYTIRVFKLFSYSVVVIILLALALNYASPFYRYPAFKWISSLIEQDYVIKKIGAIELNPKVFSNQISLSNLEIYQSEIGESQSLKIGKLEGNLDFSTFWEKGVLFEKITLDSININIETLIGILLSQKNISEIDLYKNLQIYLPDDYKVNENNRQNQLLENSFNGNFNLNKSLIKKFTNQIELTNSKILFAKQELTFISANLNFEAKDIVFKGLLNFDGEEFNVDVLMRNNESKLFFTIEGLPLSVASQLFNQPNFSFLDGEFKTNLDGYVDFHKMILQFDNFSISHPIININGSLKYEQQNNRNLEIAASITTATDINELMQIWPRDFFDEKLNNWLNSALKSGQIYQTDFLFRSSLNDIEEITKKKLFEFDIKANDLLLEYSPEWQDLSIKSAHLKINNLAMKIDAIVNDGIGNQINISSQIDSFHHDQQLKINLNSNTSGEFINQFIQNNPLGGNPKLKSLLDLNLSGKTNSQIDLIVSFEDDYPVDFSGKIELVENNIALNNWLTIKNISGEVNFDSENIATSFDATWWDNPIAVKFKNLNENELAIDFKLDFQAISSLDYFFQALEFDNLDLINQIKKSIDGETTFIGKVVATNNLKNAEDQLALNNFNLSIALNSSLEGLSLNLINPLMKSKTENTPLSIEFNYIDEKISFQSLKFNDEITASLVKGIDQSLIDVSLIDLNLDSEKIKFLVAASPTRTFEEKLNQKPLYQMGLPDLNLTVYRLRFNNRDVGSISTKFRNFSDRIELQDIELTSSSIEMKANLTSSSTQTNLVANNTKDRPLSDYSNYFQYQPITEGAISEINLNLSWLGQIWDYENAAVDGNMNIKTGDGILITNIESSFFPRLIKELSLNSIRNRLANLLAFKKIIASLNPTNVFQEGIEFDNLDIQLDFKSNQIITKKMDLNSQSIDIAIKGYMDWQTKELNHHAVVNPDLFKVLPAIGLFTGNIPVAIAGLISDKLFDTKDFFRVEYTIEGDLENPQIRILQSENPSKITQ